MNSLKVFKILDKNIRLNYSGRAEFARIINVTPQRLCNIMKNLENNKRNILNTTFEILEKAGYRVTIEKINRG